ncbi:MAG: HpcH/HpaI aldolase/citrate lyase family protein [Campylobacterota bacterium]|nr:HpcH/HpaI aldolase/citrate lyase family protein [Campylobacterota bacterium]
MNTSINFDFLDIGATLYTPAINQHLLSIAQGKKFPQLKSLVLCLEDAIKQQDLPMAMKNIETFLQEYTFTNVRVFIRPADVQNMSALLQLPNIDKIDGFALAKFGTHNMDAYFSVVNNSKKVYGIMPVIESNDMFDQDKLKQIRDFLLKQTKHTVITLRLGGEDMFKSLGLKKSCEDSIHDFHISSKIFADVLSVFKPFGFNISAPVYNCLENTTIFSKEVQRDLKEGFFGKTIIHPNQARICHELYKVSTNELNEAKAILDETNAAIFRIHDSMCEPQAHHVWARVILKRADIYGVRSIK